VLNVVKTLWSEDDTQHLANTIAQILQAGDILFLKGALGSGKTTFARYFIQSLSTKREREEVPSPTFTLAQGYLDLSKPVWHFDLYRVESLDELSELGLEEAFATGISLIEWPEKLETLHLKPRLTLTFSTHTHPYHHLVKINTDDAILFKEIMKA
jgi:tRNA threonylcarbamoyl adenosine modification protein YjeE